MEQIDSEDGDINEECHRVDATLVAKLNLADYQNAVPLLKELSITNGTKEDAKDLELRIESAPGLLKPKVWRIDAVAAGGPEGRSRCAAQHGLAFVRLLVPALTAE